MMPFTKSSSKKKPGENYTYPNTYNTSRTDPAEFLKVSQPAAPSLISRSAEEPNPRAASSNSMQRWLDQEPNDEPWYHGARFTDDTAQDGNAKP